MITSVYRKSDPHRDEDVAALLASAPPELALAMMLALWTGQRQGDLLRLLLDRSVPRSPMILTTIRGKPWTSDGFRTS